MDGNNPFDSPESIFQQGDFNQRNHLDRKYSVYLNSQKITVPPFCTCCMKPTAFTETIRYTVQKSKNGGAASDVSIDLPICPECLEHRKKAKQANWILLVISSLTALASVLLFAILFSFAEITFWALPILAAAAVFALLGLLIKLPKLGGEHSAMQKSAWISGVQLQDHYVLYTFTNYRYARLFAKTNAPARQALGSADETVPVIEEYHRNRTQNRSYFRSAEQPAVFGALTLVLTAALLLIFGSNLAALSYSAFAAPATAPASSATSAMLSSIQSSVISSSAPVSSAASSSKASSAQKSSAAASSKTTSSKSTSSKTSSARSSASASSKTSSAVSSETTEEEQRQAVIKETLSKLKAEITAMESKLRDYESRLNTLWSKYMGSKSYDDLLAYVRLNKEYEDYYDQYSWKVDYYNSLVKQYNSLNPEG